MADARVVNLGDVKFGQPSRASLVQQVANDLRELILTGDIPAGTRLLQEQVAARLQISRTPLREAFRILQQEGLLRAVPGSGSNEVIELTHRDARDLYEVREMVDGLAARLCTQRTGEREPLAELSSMLDELVRSTEPFDERRWITAHTAFHIALLAVSGNSRLQELSYIVRISSQMLSPRLASGPIRMTRSTHEHVEILEAIEAGDAALAEQRAREHIRRALAYWLADE